MLEKIWMMLIYRRVIFYNMPLIPSSIVNVLFLLKGGGMESEREAIFHKEPLQLFYKQFFSREEALEMQALFLPNAVERAMVLL